MADQKRVKLKMLKAKGLVATLLVRGFNEPRIKQMVAEKVGLSHATTAKLIRKVYDSWVEDGEQDMRVKRRRAIDARREILINAWARGNLDLALRVEDSLSDIEGTKYSAAVDNDREVTFNLNMFGSKSDEAVLRECEDDLENPGGFEKRMETQLDTFCKQYGISRE